jgi:hypothetical protein
MPAAMQANGLAPEDPASRTVEVEAFCSWSACRMKIRSIARARIGLTTYSSPGRKAHVQEVRGIIEIVARIHEGLADRIFVGQAAMVGILAIMRIEAISRCCGSLMSVES